MADVFGRMPVGDAIVWSLIGILCGCLIGWALATFDEPDEREDINE